MVVNRSDFCSFTQGDLKCTFTGRNEAVFHFIPPHLPSVMHLEATLLILTLLSRIPAPGSHQQQRQGLVLTDFKKEKKKKSKTSKQVSTRRSSAFSQLCQPPTRCPKMLHSRQPQNLVACNSKFTVHASGILAGLVHVSGGGLAVAWGNRCSWALVHMSVSHPAANASMPAWRWQQGKSPGEPVQDFLRSGLKTDIFLPALIYWQIT